MRYRLDEIAAFLQVVETGSISAVAGRLGLAKSVVSKRITDLEATLGVGLLHRSTRGVVPTDKGIAFPDSHIKSNFLCNLGYGDPSKLFPEPAPRFR
jgi:hypothetical protein